MACRVGVFITTILSISCLAHALTEIQLDDVDIHHISNPHIGRSIGIAKSFLDTLVSCFIRFPSLSVYQAYPNSSIPYSNIRFGSAMPPFTSCVVEFKGVGVDFSGVYELFSTVRHSSDNSLSLTRQRFNITITLSDYFPPQASDSYVHPVEVSP